MKEAHIDHSGRERCVKGRDPLNMYALPNAYESTAIIAQLLPGTPVNMIGAPRENKLVEVSYQPAGHPALRGFVDSRCLTGGPVEMPPPAAAAASKKNTTTHVN